MEFISASLGRAQDELYQRLLDCNVELEGPELAMFTVALLNVTYHPTDVMLMLAFGKFSTAKKSQKQAHAIATWGDIWSLPGS